MHPLPHPEGNGARPISPVRRPVTPASGPPRPPVGVPGWTGRLQLGDRGRGNRRLLLCLSATSLYALGVQAGYSWWQAAAVPVVADGPAIYGMFRIVSRSRRAPRAPAMGGCWSSPAPWPRSAATSPTPTRPGRPAIAAAIPLAVLAMLEGLKGDAGEVTRLAAQAAAGDGAGTPRASRPAPAGHDRSTRRPDHQPTPCAGDLQRRAAGAARRVRTRPTWHGRGAAAGGLCPPRPDGQAWTARTLAEAAGCGRSSAASFLQRQRPSTAEARREPAQLAAPRRGPRLCLPRHPGAAPALPPPPPNGLQPVPGDPRRGGKRSCSCRYRTAANLASTPRAPDPYRVTDATCNRARVLACVDPPPRQHRPGHRPPVRRAGRRRPRRHPGHPELAATHRLPVLGAAGPDW